MLFKRHNINKAISSLLLVLLLLIHSIKILHTHSNSILVSNHNCAGDSKEKNNVSQVSSSTVDCSICSYQINKDTDGLPAPPICDLVAEPSESNSKLTSSQILSFHTAFENRGPPLII